MPPVLPGSVSTVAVLVPAPPEGRLVKRAGTVMVALIKPTAVASSGPSGQLMVLPATVQVPPPGKAGWLRVNVTAPVRATPAGKASVKSVCSELPGPLLTTPIVQVKGCISVTVAALLVLVTRRSNRCRVVVASPSVLLARSVSGSLALVTARLL